MNTSGEDRASSALLRGHALLDRGFTSDVFEWGGGRILKLFHSGTPVAKAEAESTATRAVNAMGLPVPAVYDVIDVDGRPGIVMQRIVGISLLQQVQSRPWLLPDAIRRLAEVHARINSCPAIPPVSMPTESIF